MRLRLDIKPRADKDLGDIAEYIAADSLDHAIRFLFAARQTMEFLTTSPRAGAEYELASGRRLKGLRKWGVRGFRNYLILYRVGNETIEIVRVVHGARDIPTLLQDEI